jgi:ABC-type uncharacterized transport system substrate-binding protein
MRPNRSLIPAAMMLAAGTVAASAHPHVFVDAKTEVVFDQSGRMTAVRNIWEFDEAFSQFAIQGLHTDGDGKTSDAELKPLADVNVKSLKEYKFFTYLTVGRDEVKFVTPTEYWLELRGGRLTLFFTLPMEKPMVPGKHAMLEIFDPEYFVAFTFLKDNPVELVGAPKNCSGVYHPPHRLDASTMAILAAIPADQHDLPLDLRDAASVLANHVTVSCLTEAAGKIAVVSPVGPSPANASQAAALVGAGGNPISGGLKAADADDGPAGTKPDTMPTAATRSVAAADGESEKLPAPAAHAGSASSAVTGGSPDALGGSNSSLTLLGVALFLVAAAGGVVVFFQRRPSRSRSH